MRVTLVTETYFPQVNGVSRTLGELVRFLTESGDRVQLIHPDYGEAVDHVQVHAVRSIVLPFYKELYLPRPPFGAVHRAIDAFQPDIVHIATEATLGWSVLRRALRRRLSRRLQFPHQLRPVQRALPGRLGAGRDLAISALVSQPDRRDLRPFGGNDPRARAPGLRAAGAVEARGRQLLCFGPSGRAAWRCAGRWAGRPRTW